MIFNKKESRKDERFYPKGNAYIVFSPGFIKRGPIINISKGGLVCLYFVDKTSRERHLDRYINIRCNGFTMGNIPYKIIADTKLSDDQHGGHRIIRKRSIQFCDLSAVQKDQIAFFIKNHTKKSITDYRGVAANAFKLPFV